MCDYCDCRSTTEIADLAAEHEVLLHLLHEVDVTTARSQDAPIGVIAALSTLLDAHAHREEQGVFTQLRLAGIDPAYVDRFADEHAVIDQLLHELEGPGRSGAARRLVDTLSDHILREESDLYPAAHQLLRDEQWEAIAARHT